MSASCGKHGRREFATIPPCFSFCDVQLSGGNFLKPRAKVKNVVTALQFFRAAIVTQLMNTLRHNNGARVLLRWTHTPKEPSLFTKHEIKFEIMQNFESTQLPSSETRIKSVAKSFLKL